MSEDNPMMALLMRHTETTELDNLYKKPEPAKKAETKEMGPVLVIDDEDSGDVPIGLTHRQPSFSSLHGNIVMKGGEMISDLPKLTEVSIEGTAEEEEDVPIGLNVRHSSYASLSIGQAIPKGQSKPTNKKDIISITEEISEEPTGAGNGPYFNEKNENETEEEEDEEEDKDPNVILVKQLKAKNTNRWKEMGYEPPKNLIPLVRAASQSQLGIGSLSSHPSNTAAFTPIHEKLSEPPMNIPVISEEVPVKLQEADAPKPNSRKRSGSFGTKIGETTSQALMESIIRENPNTIELTLGEIDDDDEAIGEEEEENWNEEEDKDELRLYGRLDQIVSEDCNSPLFLALQNGYVEDENDVTSVRKGLANYLQITQRNRWEEESDFIKRIMSRMPESRNPQVSQIKSNAISQEIINAYENCENEISSVQQQLDKILDTINSDYMEEATKLDAYWQDPKTLSKYNKPSSDLINMRSKLKNSVTILPKREIDSLKKMVRDLEEKETKAKNQMMAKSYHNADRALKDKYVKKRVNATKKYETQITKIEITYDQKIALLKSQLAWAKKVK